jgi:methylmalonyl-CoA/ethylmalonyl-CoA epimerase
MPLIKINHIAVVVPEIDAALHFWRDALGLHLERIERNESEAVEIAFLPTSDDSGVARYLAKTGGGLHHICLEVEDIDAALAQLTAHNIELINGQPRTRPDGIRYAFVHPRSAGGVLVELYEVAKS